MIIWLITAALLLLIEVLTQAIWAMCFSVGALFAMIFAGFTDSWVLQALAVAAGALLAWLLLAPIVRKWEKGLSHESRTGMDALLGRRATVTEEIKPGELGRARIDGDYWQVRAPESKHTVRRGEEVVVTAYESIILTVNTL